jgi:hypothetical protein
VIGNETKKEQMKSTTNAKVAIWVAAFLAAPNLFAAYDGIVTFNGLGGGNDNSGGVFNVLTTPTGGSPNLGNFGTFCIEKNEFVAVFGSSYRYFINDGAVAGGNGGQTLPNDPVTGLAKDRISIGTAYLYSQFRAGAIGVTAAQKTDLQLAIWYLENEITSLDDGPGGLIGSGTAYYNLAKTGTSTDDTTVFNASLGAYGVVALNLFQDSNNNGIYDAGDVAKQDQLGIVPEPGTLIAGALLLLPFGASTIRILRKNRQA